MYIAHLKKGWTTAHSEYDIDAIPKGSTGEIFYVPDKSVFLILKDTVLKNKFVTPDLSEFQLELFKESMHRGMRKLKDQWEGAYMDGSLIVYKVCSSSLPDIEAIEKMLLGKYDFVRFRIDLSVK